MSRFIRIVRNVALPLVTAMVMCPAAQAWTAQVDLPFETAGALESDDGDRVADFRIVVPAEWNGTLFVYARGYNQPLVPQVAPHYPPGMEAAMLAQGYALAGSRWSSAGHAVFEGLHETADLTQYFRETVGTPDRTILWGTSLGSIVALESMENFPGLYDGAIAACAGSGGISANMDFLLGMSLAYDVTFGWPDTWGTVGDVRDDLSTSETFPRFISHLLDPGSLSRLEFIRRVCGIPQETFYAAGGPSSLNGYLLDMFFATSGRAELEVRAKAPVAQNLDQQYTLSEQDMAVLAAMGLDATPLLAEMNARTHYGAPRKARSYLERYADFTGKIKRPVLTMHNIKDPVLAPWNEIDYYATVSSTGREDLLLQVFAGPSVDADGTVHPNWAHCEFSAGQILWVVAAMEYWIDTGERPPDVYFPIEEGFQLDFVPAPWPF